MERLKLENNLRKALEKEELLVYYQPQVDMNTFEIIGMEVLIRWQHPQNGSSRPTSSFRSRRKLASSFPSANGSAHGPALHNKNWFSKNLAARACFRSTSPLPVPAAQAHEDDLGVLKETGFRPQLPRARDHRKHPDAEGHRADGDSARNSREWASSSRSTTSAQGIHRSAI